MILCSAEDAISSSRKELGSGGETLRGGRGGSAAICSLSSSSDICRVKSPEPTNELGYREDSEGVWKEEAETVGEERRWWREECGEGDVMEERRGSADN